MRLTVFWERMTEYFGAGYADTFARDHVMSELGGRTVHEALAAAGTPRTSGWWCAPSWMSPGTALIVT